MTQEGISYRARLKAPDTKFSHEEEQLLVGWIIYRDLTFLSTTTEKFRYFVYEHFARDVSPTYISNFMKRWNLSLKLVGNAKREESFNHEQVCIFVFLVISLRIFYLLLLYYYITFLLLFLFFFINQLGSSRSCRFS